MVIELNKSNDPCEYKIPDAIKKNIPDYFYIAMVGELVSIFGPSVLAYDDCQENGCDECDLVCHEGTSGWVAALEATCEKLDMMWLLTYWHGLDWIESDLFDAEIGDEIIRWLASEHEEHERANAYYHYCLKRRE